MKAGSAYSNNKAVPTSVGLEPLFFNVRGRRKTDVQCTYKNDPSNLGRVIHFLELVGGLKPLYEQVTQTTDVADQQSRDDDVLSDFSDNVPVHDFFLSQGFLSTLREYPLIPSAVNFVSTNL